MLAFKYYGDFFAISNLLFGGVIVKKYEEDIYYSFFIDNNFFNDDFKASITKQINFENKLPPNLIKEFDDVVASIRNFYVNQSKNMISYAIHKANKSLFNK